MKAILATAALAAAAPLAAEPTPEQAEAIAAADAFFAALRSDDKTALARQMLPEGVIFIHNRMKPDAPRVDAVPVAKHLERWASSPEDLDEVMAMQAVLVDGDMAQVWGPYRFMVRGETTHCGINSLSMVKTDSGWRVANTSFTMELPSECARLGAPEAGE
jgi:ketosteroid isomerase-like protein